MSDPATADDARHMVVEVNIYPTRTVRHNTPRVTGYAIFERQSLSEDLTAVLASGMITLINCTNKIKQQGFKKDAPSDPTPPDPEHEDEDDVEDDD